MQRPRNFWSVIFSLFIVVPLTSLHAIAAEKPPFSICALINYFSGELEFAHRMKRACDHLGWNLEICDIDSRPVGNHDCSLLLVPGKAARLGENSYLALFAPGHLFFDGNHLKKKYLHHLGYLPIYEDRTFLAQDVPVNTIYPNAWYPTAQYRPYVEVKPQRLFYVLSSWGTRKDDLNYRLLLTRLSQSGYANFFINDKKIGKMYGTAYRGGIPFDGETMLKTISEMGVCLIMHSKTHLEYGIPSGRIFEAAAASAVIISDQNSFVMDNFGDTVLYFDETASGIEMFNQIDRHMRWIRSHPKEATAMAYGAHKIFEEKFLLEQQLLEFRDFHERRMAEVRDEKR